MKTISSNIKRLACTLGFLPLAGGVFACDFCHLNDPFKRGEHTSALDLTPPTAATHRAVQSGPWSSPSTWSSGTVPGADARVHIPNGIAVTYDVDSGADLFWLLVQGQLSFSTSVNTRLVIDTIVVAPEGRWEQGTATNPIPAAVTSRVIFSDRGPIDVTWDPKLLSRGIVSHGALSIEGAAKTSHVQMNPATVGATSLSLVTAPNGWEVGDTLVIAGTRLTVNAVRHVDYQDEIRRITAISGTNVTLDAPLVFDHTPPQSLSPVPLHGYVGNFSRNISFESANKNMTDNAQIQRRGHMMCMHSDAVSVRYAAFNDMGRTNKALLVDDPPASPMNVYENYTDASGFHAPGSTITGAGTNPRGRYSVHFHLCGSDDANTVDGTGPHYTYRKAVVCQGVSTMNSPGWAYSNHDSHVNMDDCVSFNSVGAGFVEESGNGIGRFQNCLSIRNGMKSNNPRQGDFRENLGLLDLGFAGHGFFYRGNLVETYSCVAASCDSAGFAWNGKHGQGGSMISAQNLPYPAIANGAEMIRWDNTPIAFLRDCTVFASVDGIYEYYSQPKGDGRSYVERPLVWNVYGDGIVVVYGNFEGQVTVSDAVVLADSAPNAFNDVSRGLISNSTIHDVIYDNCYVRGFNEGIRVDNDNGTSVSNIVLLDNNQFVDCNASVVNPDNLIGFKTAPIDRTELSFTADPNQNPSNIQHPVNIRGTKVDPLGAERKGDVTNDGSRQFPNPFSFDAATLRGILAKGYFHDADGTFIVLPYAVYSRLVPVSKTYYHKLYLDFTNWFVKDEVRGPDLGAFTDPGVARAPRPSFAIPSGTSLMNGQTVALVCPIPGAHMYYTTDGSTPAVTADFQPLGTTKRYATPIYMPPGGNTLQAFALAGLMAPSEVATASYTMPASGLADFRGVNGLAADGTQDMTTPAGDGVANLLKYAFNMVGSQAGQATSLSAPNSAPLASDRIAGLPVFDVNASGSLRVTYLRRKAPSNSGVSYAVEFSDALNRWAPNALAAESTASIDATFERVTVTDSVVFPLKRFARVRVSSP